MMKPVMKPGLPVAVACLLLVGRISAAPQASRTAPAPAAGPNAAPGLAPPQARSAAPAPAIPPTAANVPYEPLERQVLDF